MGLEIDHIAEVLISFSDSQYSIGTAYRIGPRHLLTAKHVVHGKGVRQVEFFKEGSIRFLVRGAQYLSVKPFWDSDDQDDLSILELQTLPGDAAEIEAVRWGVLSRKESISCKICGFPKAAMKDNRRDSFGLDGVINPYGGFKDDKLQIEVPDIQKDEDLEGLSGAPVFVEDFLVGVVLNRIPGFSRLWAQPVSKLFTAGKFSPQPALESTELVVIDEIDVIRQRSAVSLSPEDMADIEFSPDELLERERLFYEVRNRLAGNVVIQYLRDTDTIDELLRTFASEVPTSTTSIRTALKLLVPLVVGEPVKETTIPKASFTRNQRILLGLPFYSDMMKWLLSLQEHLAINEEARQRLDAILSGRRPSHDSHYGGELSQSLSANLQFLIDLQGLNQAPRRTLEQLAASPPPQPPLKLTMFPVTESSRFHFRAQWVPFLGRRADFDRLQRFLDTERDFVWWLILGEAGQGKSRIALELCLRNSIYWRVGFFQDLPPFTEWNDWQPDRPTLIVADYASSKLEALKTIILGLSDRPTPLDWPVRLLLLDRNAESPSWQTFYGSGTDRLAVEEARYEVPLELGSMDREDIWEMVCFILREAGGEELPDKEQTLIAIESIDPTRRPLFVTLAAYAVASGRDIRDWDKSVLMTDLLKREKEQYWKPAGVSIRDENLLVLATMTGGFPLEALGVDSFGIPLPSADTFAPDSYDATRYEIITGQAATEHVPPLEPDILGEFFVLSYLTPSSQIDVARAERMRLVAWRTKPEGMYHFLNHAAGDFLDHPTLSLLIKRAEEDVIQRAYWSGLIALFLQRLLSVSTNNFVVARSLFGQVADLVASHEDESGPSLLMLAYCSVSFVLICFKAAAIDDALRAHELISQLATSHSEDPDLRQTLSQLRCILAVSLAQKSDKDGARRVHEQSVAAFVLYPNEPETFDWIARSAEGLCEVYESSEEFDHVYEILAQTINLGLHFQERDQFIEFCENSGLPLISAYLDGEDLTSALRTYTLLSSAMTGAISHIEYRQELVACAGQLADELIDIGDTVKARGVFDTVSRLLSKYLEDANLAEGVLGIAVNLIGSLGSNGDVTTAWEVYQQVSILLDPHSDNPWIRLEIAACASGIIYAYAEVGNISAVRREMDNLRRLCERFANDVGLWKVFLVTMVKGVEAFISSGDLESATRLYGELGALLGRSGVEPDLPVENASILINKALEEVRVLIAKDLFLLTFEFVVKHPIGEPATINLVRAGVVLMSDYLEANELSTQPRTDQPNSDPFQFGYVLSDVRMLYDRICEVAALASQQPEIIALRGIAALQLLQVIASDDESNDELIAIVNARKSDFQAKEFIDMTKQIYGAEFVETVLPMIIEVADDE